MKLIIITWRANSWKTTLADIISKHFWIKRISASDYTKSLVNADDRILLENKFNEIVKSKWYWYYVKQVIDYWDFSNNLWIIDWPRHYELIKWFIECVWKENCLIIWIWISQKNRYSLATKWGRKESVSFEKFCEFEKNSTHEIFADDSVNNSDIKIWDELISNTDITINKLIKKINNFKI